MNRNILRIIMMLLSALFMFASCNKDDDNDDNSGDGSYRENKEKSENYILKKRNVEGVRESSTGLLFKAENIDNTKVRPELEDSIVARIRCERFDGVCCADTTFKLLLEEQIKGLQEGISYMTEGSKMELFVPYYLAFGSTSTKYFYNNRTISILPYTAMHYNIELKQVIKR